MNITHNYSYLKFKIFKCIHNILIKRLEIVPSLIKEENAEQHLALLCCIFAASGNVNHK